MFVLLREEGKDPTLQLRPLWSILYPARLSGVFLRGQTMRVKQFELFREDIRDLMNLTVAKMDNYLIATCPEVYVLKSGPGKEIESTN